MKIEILGTGCYQCIKMEELVNDVVRELDLQGVEIVRISDEHAIRKLMPPDEIPGMLIDGRLVCTRTSPDRKTLLGWLAEARQAA